MDMWFYVFTIRVRPLNFVGKKWTKEFVMRCVVIIISLCVNLTHFYHIWHGVVGFRDCFIISCDKVDIIYREKSWKQTLHCLSTKWNSVYLFYFILSFLTNTILLSSWYFTIFLFIRIQNALQFPRKHF